MEEPTADLNQAAAEFAARREKRSGCSRAKIIKSSCRRAQGSLRHEVWEGIPGSDLNSLTSHPKFKSGGPDFTGYLGATQSPTNAGDDFGRKISGILTPPEDGAYRFWLYADDQCILKLNDAEKTPTGPRRFFAFLRTLRADWGQALESRPVSLRKDRRYYFEILHKEGGGDDFAPWVGPCRTAPSNAPFPGSVFSYPTLIGP